jgi:hypothetical protein
MAVEESVVSITIEAGADLSAGQYKFVTVASDGQVDLTASAGGAAIGVLQNAPDAAGVPATVAIAGRVKVTAGGTVAAGNKVQSDASGDAIVAASGDTVLGYALQAADDGDVFAIALISQHILA